jgi:hypothetical protein
MSPCRDLNPGPLEYEAGVTLFKKPSPVYFENRRKTINTLCWDNSELLIMQVVHIVTTVFQ